MNAQQILQTYSFDPHTGNFQKIAGKPSKRGGVLETAKGYLRLRIGGKYRMAHHVAWLLTHGTWPSMQIDHINGNRSDNRPGNLREVSPLHNSQNQRRAHQTNAVGLLGVCQMRHPQLKSVRWRAQIKVNGKSVHLGVFANPGDAHAAYLAAKRALHPGCTI